jgi:hypothetical protein
MSKNPYEPPMGGSPPPPSFGPDPMAASKVSGPATGLMVAGGINILVSLFSLVMNLMGVGMGAAEGGDEAAFAMLGGGMGMVLAVIGLVVAVVIIMGAMKMKNLESYGFAMTASVLAMIPCLSSCCIVGLPLGIWALITLNNPGVKASFR